MNEYSKYEILVIGSGPGGYRCAELLAASGRKVCLAEQKEENLGGVCLNEGCIPAKTLIECGENFRRLQTSKATGLKVKEASIDIDELWGLVKSNLAVLKAGLQYSLKKSGVEIKYAKASFIDKETVLLQGSEKTETVKADIFIIASGSVPRKIRMPGLDDDQLVYSSQLDERVLKSSRILIIGGGYIGCEYASFFNNIGAEVTVLEMKENLLPGEDRDISSALEKEFKRKGISVYCSDSAVRAEYDSGKYMVELDKTGVLRGFDNIIAAVGRKAHTCGLSLDKAGIEQDSAGYIYTDKYFRTSIDNIYAVGDVINSPMLAYTAYYEAMRVFNDITGAANEEEPGYVNIPRIVFSSPSVACIGITEQYAAANGIELEIKRRNFKANSKAVILNESRGFIKLLFSREDDILLGASIIGPSSTEIIHTLSVCINNAMTTSSIKKLVFGHPTLSEIIYDSLL